jgi:integrase
LFNLAIDSKLRACDLVNLRVRDIAHGDHIALSAIVLQQKTPSPVQFEITEQTRTSVGDWIKHASLHSDCYLFRTRQHQSPHLSTRQYARIVDRWIGAIGLDVCAYGTHTMRRTKASLIYRRTKNLRAVQLLLGTASSRAPSAIWVLKSMMPWRWRNRPKCELDWPDGDWPESLSGPNRTPDALSSPPASRHSSCVSWRRR